MCVWGGGGAEVCVLRRGGWVGCGATFVEVCVSMCVWGGVQIEWETCAVLW